MAVSSFTSSGSKSTSAPKLDKTIFEVTPKNHELLKAAYNYTLDNRRQNLAVTKTRGLISGGGRKPWKQKGTGRARFGSSRNPIWRGGGIVFGPTGNENYSKQLNVKSKRLALAQAFSLALADNKIIIIEEFKLKTAKTKELSELLTKINAKGNVHIITDSLNPELYRASNNLPQVHVITAKYSTVFNLMNADTVILTQKALDIVHSWLASSSKPATPKVAKTAEEPTK